jgi:hypothetical protein
MKEKRQQVLSFVILFSSVNSSQKNKHNYYLYFNNKNSEKIKFQWAIAHLPPPWLRH